MAILKSSTHYGRPIELEGFSLMPISKSHQIRLRDFPAGLRWERPVGVLVRSDGGEEKVLPIEDVTRKAQIAMVLLAVAVWLYSKRRVRK